MEQEIYPTSLTEFEAQFASQEDCIRYLAKLRWPNGFLCPQCGNSDAWSTARGLWHCRICNRQTSVTAGTILHGVRSTLPLWFRAMWHITSQKYGANALGLKRTLGLGSYQTAWEWLHKLRRAMVRPGRDRLQGCVEVDETYLGGAEEGVRGRETKNKTIVCVAAEEDGRGIGRIRLRRIADVSSKCLHPFVEQCVAPGAVVHTDAWRGYSGINAKGYTHNITVLSQHAEPAHQLMPRVHRVASLLKRWLLGTHQGAVSEKHLDYYLDEFTFRFNRRRSRVRGLLFYRLLQNAAVADPVSYGQLVRGQSDGDHKI